MIGTLAFTRDGQVYPTYVVDVTGNLVRCTSEALRAGSLIAGATEVVATAGELANPSHSVVNEPLLVSVNKITNK